MQEKNIIYYLIFFKKNKFFLMIYINNENEHLECEDENVDEILKNVVKNNSHLVKVLHKLADSQDDNLELTHASYKDILVRLERIEGAILFLCEKFDKKEERKRKNDFLFNLD